MIFMYEKLEKIEDADKYAEEILQEVRWLEAISAKQHEETTPTYIVTVNGIREVI